jgi:hypothetical protein
MGLFRTIISNKEAVWMVSDVLPEMQQHALGGCSELSPGTEAAMHEMRESRLGPALGR